MSDANKAVVRRLVEEVLNGGRLEVIPERYAPDLAGAATAWTTPFRASFPDTHMEIVDCPAFPASGDERVACPLLPSQ